MIMKNFSRTFALASALLFTVSFLRAAPVFVGTSQSYISNSANGGLWTFVISNVVQATFSVVVFRIR